ncbi:hypothetical protein [Calothrix sp. 336/3]|uniref:hypothetical protein n=1 Tax=Calothrix sp. 336/3 TaxID=1337936 RepID=UPI0004E38412|nr:hypothetical protein [Calothrix sp. 336/3]AKG23847.1 hypothetical protein IJ00_23375 [Calothrix sp. 336/3]
MTPIKFLTSACRYCRYYKPEGRRGGVCQQLGAPVQAKWKACSLALPPFAPSWETLEDVWSLPEVSHSVLSHRLHTQTTAVPIETTVSCLAAETPKTEELVMSLETNFSSVEC